MTTIENPAVGRAMCQLSKMDPLQPDSSHSPEGNQRYLTLGPSNALSLNTPRIRCRTRHLTERAEFSNQIHFKYLAEGAANAVFKIEPAGDEPNRAVFVDVNDEVLPRASFLSKVLRISKRTGKSLKCEDVMAGFEKDVRPLFQETKPAVAAKSSSVSDRNLVVDDTPSVGASLNPESQHEKSLEEHLMDHEGVYLDQAVTADLVLELNKVHGPGGHNVLQAGQWGILLPDMSSVPEESVTIEVKPKWLLQSPNAPRDAHRCRTCALQEMRWSMKSSYICPLRLLSGDSLPDNVTLVREFIAHRVLEALAESKDTQPHDVVESATKRAMVYLTSGPGHKLLQHLKTLQQRLDPLGVLGADKVSRDEIKEYHRRLRLAMTLRDCSLFMKIPFAEDNTAIESKLGDLDFKSADKIGDWEVKERQLLDGGWYTSHDREIAPRELDECWISVEQRKGVPSGD